MLTSFLLPSRPFDMLTMTAKPRGLCWTSSYTSSSAVDVTSFVYCFAVSLLCPFRLCDDDRSPNSAPSDDSLSANVQFGSQSSRLGQQLLPFKVDNTMFQLLWLSYTFTRRSQRSITSRILCQSHPQYIPTAVLLSSVLSADAGKADSLLKHLLMTNTCFFHV